MKTKNKRNSVLKKIAYIKGLTRSDISKAANLSKPTVTLYLNSPQMMNGIMRAKFAKILSIDICTIDDIVNGKVKDASDLIIEKETILNHVKK
jgi:DNA-binding transcriptional regulator LsrR (DeoR family)